MVGLFTPWKLAGTTDQSLICSFVDHLGLTGWRKFLTVKTESRNELKLVLKLKEVLVE